MQIQVADLQPWIGVKLLQIGKNSGAFWGETSILLGWYADETSIKMEMDNIAQAIKNGLPEYNLKYAVKVKNKMLRVKIDSK